MVELLERMIDQEPTNPDLEKKRHKWAMWEIDDFERFGTAVWENNSDKPISPDFPSADEEAFFYHEQRLARKKKLESEIEKYTRTDEE